MRQLTWVTWVLGRPIQRIRRVALRSRGNIVLGRLKAVACILACIHQPVRAIFCTG